MRSFLSRPLLGALFIGTLVLESSKFAMVKAEKKVRPISKKRAKQSHRFSRRAAASYAPSIHASNGGNRTATTKAEDWIHRSGEKRAQEIRQRMLERQEQRKPDGHEAQKHGRNLADDPPIVFLELPEDGGTVQATVATIDNGEFADFFVLPPTGGSFEEGTVIGCTTEADNGDVDLFLLTGDPDDPCCDCEGVSDYVGSSEEQAAVVLDSSSEDVFVSIEAYADTTGIVLTCGEIQECSLTQAPPATPFGECIDCPSMPQQQYWTDNSGCQPAVELTLPVDGSVTQTFSVSEDGYVLFDVFPPAGGSFMEGTHYGCTTTSTDDVDLLVAWINCCDESAENCDGGCAAFSGTSGSGDEAASVEFTADDMAPLFVDVYGDEASTNVVLTCEETTAQATMDPHFETLTGRKYDFQGECDLVLLNNAKFANGLGLDVHIRTTIRDFYSYIEAVGIKLGNDILSVDNNAALVINGVEQDKSSDVFFGDYMVKHALLDTPVGQKSSFKVSTGENGQGFDVVVWDVFVSVKVNQHGTSAFEGSTGMIGGAMAGRDGNVVLEDPGEFAREWQVRQDLDPFILETVRAPQYPAACIMPDPAVVAERRLRNAALHEKAEALCEHWGAMKDECVYDVIATGNLGLAQAF